MPKDDKWFASIKWDNSCLQCQAKTNGVCENRSCAEDNYDPWGDPIPAYVYHHDGNTLNEYLENKRKRIESGEYIPASPTTSVPRQNANVDTSIALKDLDLPARVAILIRRYFEAETVADLLEKVRDIDTLISAFKTNREKMLLERLLKELDEKSIRLADCSTDKYPNIDTYILDKVISEISVISYGTSESFVEYLKDEGCENMADVLRLSPDKLTTLTGDLRLEAIDYLRALRKRGQWRLFAVSEETYPDWEKYILEAFAYNLSDLPFSTRLQNSFIKHAITNTAELVQYSRSDLHSQKIAGERGIAEIVKVLFDIRMHLSGDTFYYCEICHKKGVKQADDEKTKLCKDCTAKQRRIAQMKDVCVSISGPDYGSYTNLSSGFTLYANIENKTDEFMEVTLTDFYVFSEGRQRAPLYYLNGYSFDKEHLFANTSKTAGKIFPVTGLKDGRLSVGDYVVIKIRTNSKEFRMFKFVYTDTLDKTWRIDDYREF